MDLTPGLRRDPAPDLEAVGEDEALVARIRDEIRRRRADDLRPVHGPRAVRPGRRLLPRPERRPGRDRRLPHGPRGPPDLRPARSRASSTRRWVGSVGRHRSSSASTAPATGPWRSPSSTASRRDGSGLERAIALRPGRGRAPPRSRRSPRDSATPDGRDILAGPAAVADPIVGVVLANEVLDALPVHRVRRRGGALARSPSASTATGSSRSRSSRRRRPSPPASRRRASSWSTARRAEICLALDGWVGDAAAGLARGLLLLIDYGAIATELYDPVRRRDGTLRAYLRHRVHDDPYRHVGRQDLTAHVDVTAVERAAHAPASSTSRR